MTSPSESFACWIVRKDEEGSINGRVEPITESDLPAVEGPEVLIEVEWSSLNYKDAMACRGHRGVAPQLPHVPGIDCAGRVVRSDSADWAPGQQVLVTGYDLGAPKWGGLSQRVLVPADWPVAMPESLDAKAAMTYGTAGFTAAQCVLAVTDRVAPDAGPVAVTGASGGVGCLSVAILAKLGYSVTAVSGKPDLRGALEQIGAAEVVGRDEVTDDGKRPLLAERWAAAVDTVGGAPLSNLLRSTSHRGVVAACGVVAGDQLPLTVYPFILRGVTLAGIDSAKCPRGPRLEVWRRLAGDWRVELPDELVTAIGLGEVGEQVERMLAGGSTGRTVVRVGAG